MRRVLLLVAVAAMVCVPAAGAWTWPTDGAVLQSFVFDGAHPYAAGEHRGIDVAGAPGADVRAPSAGTVTFAGSVPGSGEAVTILTGDGYAVTLTHLAALAVARGASIAEGAVVGRLADEPGAFVHLGVRFAEQQQGYVDPASLLPSRRAAQPPAVSPQPPAAPTPVPAAVAVATPVADTAAAVPAPAPAAAVPATEAAFVIRASAPRVSSGGLRVVAPAPTRRLPVVAPSPVARVAEPTVEARPAVRPLEAVSGVVAPRGYVARHTLDAPASRVRIPSLRARPAIPFAAIVGLALASLLLAARVMLSLPGVRKAARIIGRRVDVEAQDSGGTGLAVRGWASAPRARRGIRSAGGRLRPVSPFAWERRADGQRDRRARNADHGRRGSRGEVLR